MAGSNSEAGMAAAAAQLRDDATSTFGDATLESLPQLARSLTGLAWSVDVERRARSFRGVGRTLRVELERSDGKRAAVDLAPSMGRFLVEQVLGVEATTMPEEPATLGPTEEGVLLFLAASLLPEAGAWTVRDCAAVNLSASEPRLSAAISYLGTLRVGAAKGWVRLHLSPPGAQPIAGNGESRRAQGTGLSVMVHVDGGIGRFSSRELQELEPGDRMLFYPMWINQLNPLEGPVRLSSGAPAGPSWQFLLQGEQLLLQKRLQESFVADPPDDKSPPDRTKQVRLPSRPSSGHRPEETQRMQLPPVETAHTRAPDPTADAFLEEAPVEVSVELARFYVSLDELQTLAEGEVLNTDTPVGAKVRLRARGEVVAEGRLVDIDGELGVEIIRRI